MLDFEIQRPGRRCAKSDREFSPGETFYSALVAEGGDVVRRDFSAEAWEGPPAQTIGWWKCQMPGGGTRRVNWAPNDVLQEYFQQLEGQADKQDVRYILTLLMIRRRILRLEDTEQDEAGREVLVVFCARSETEHRVPVVTPSAQRVREIQDELACLLFAGSA
jgi:hypothetical protein